MSAQARQILLIDPDEETRAKLHAALTELGCSVESANDGNGALDVLQTMRVDAVICDAELPDMTGLQLHRRLMQASRLRSVPFTLLMRDTGLDALTVALAAGVDDCVHRPADPRALAARVDALVRRQRRLRDALRTRRYLLAGDFSAMSLPDLVSTLSLQRRTGTIAVVSERAVGEVHLDAGEVVNAAFGNLVGVDAFFAMFGEDSAQFEFAPRDATPMPHLRAINASVAELVMEAARRFDEASLPGGTPVPRPQARVAPVARPQQILAPDSALARSVVEAVQDGFALGELFLWVGTELDNWVRREGHQTRLHIHLVADLNPGVAAMLALAAPPGERLVSGGLRNGQKSAGLVYFLKDDHLLDVVLVDIDSIAARVHALSRRPCITVLAPRNGDFLELGPRAQVGIHSLLMLRTPSLLVGVGNPAMTPTLEQLAPQGCRSLLVPGALDDGQTDLREVLCKSIAAWGEGTSS